MAVFTRRGFSFLELLIAAAILAVTAIILLQAATCSLALNLSSRELTSAVTHAQYVMEEIKGTDYQQISSKISGGDWDWDSAAISQRGLAPLTDEAVDTAISAASGILYVTVTASWNDKAGRPRSVSLATKFFDLT